MLTLLPMSLRAGQPLPDTMLQRSIEKTALLSNMKEDRLLLYFIVWKLFSMRRTSYNTSERNGKFSKNEFYWNKHYSNESKILSWVKSEDTSLKSNIQL